ncbi:MAG: c-type cytochrome [Hyphomicrobium sp.]|uniref:c-type cytochrome n=1 Tax=Hyphomicrobium sp. TaxID=82 RepID=UPI001320C27F|nr:c-type cytochrome [Hyphomicrobium sp.]KAB2942571.1 MAG: c-type cytochrome [Hyphomicrobium sp.]MBZ0208548.1 c-type cytochrome [Hyphomicrobium sp.]
MQRVLRKAAAALALGAVVAYVNPISAADTSAPPVPPAQAEGAAPAPLSMDELKKPMKPLERVAASPKGTLKNPYTDNPEAIAEGQKLYFGKSCNGCHGGGGGGGMCPPLTNTVWVYGDTDDTLFRLISLGSDELKKAGYARKGTEGVVGPMPPFGELIDTDQDVWKIIAWIRTKFAGGPERRHW